jgi:glutamine amidotransferase
MITIVDYGMGNLYSVANALQFLGVSHRISADPKIVCQADRVILPGVGSFREATLRLQATGLQEALRECAGKERPLLGICLGMQLLATGGDEGGESSGLGLISGRVVRLETNENLPHMGWNQLQPVQDDPLLKGLDPNPFVYFVHSYVLQPEEHGHEVARAIHGKPFCAMVRSGSVTGVQFHPEKSSSAGMRLLQNFCEGRNQS